MTIKHHEHNVHPVRDPRERTQENGGNPPPTRGGLAPTEIALLTVLAVA